MTAALYARRNGKTALVIEKAGFGGQITHSPRVENFPGTKTMSGNEFADALLDQILYQGAEIEIETVASITCEGDVRKVRTEEGSEYEAKAVVIAVGVRHRMLGLPGEEELVGEGVSFCAVCDGDFYTGKDVCVAGGGNSALQEAVLLSDKCSSVTILQDLPYLTAEEKLQETVLGRDNVTVITDVAVTGLLTENGGFTGVEITGRTDKEVRSINCDGLFVAIGLIPENGPFEELARLNEYGYFDSDEQCLTKTPGIFVAGDCRSKHVRQLTTAAADGAVAALAACRYINNLKV